MTSTVGVRAQRHAEPALFASLLDDAAVFPPGNAPLDEAVRLHHELRHGPYAALVGPLLVPAAGVATLVSVAAEPLRVAVIGRPGVPHAEVAAAVAEVRSAPGLEVAGIEVGWTADWRDTWLADHTALEATPLTLEVPRGDEQAAAIADIAADASDSLALQAKFRTGATEAWPWPDEPELAAFVRAAIDHDLGFKLTGGLHHAVRGTYPVDGPVAGPVAGPVSGPGTGATEEQHGLLNVVCAVRWALNGEEVEELVPLLEDRDAANLVPQVERMSAADASIVRAFFTAYGCCGVLDPIRELAALGLVEGA
jgi:hypothetical protein